MKITKIKKGLVLVSIAAGMLAAGCELIVDFDRTRIPTDADAAVPGDASTPTGDASIPTDGATSDASDAGDTTDASDAGSDDAGDADAG